MDTIALITQKGGSGKTTLTLSLAVAAVLAGRTTLVIDLDTQGTACSWHDRRKAAGKGDSPIVIDAQPHRLADTLKQARANGVDFVLIDTPPRAAASPKARKESSCRRLHPNKTRPSFWKRSTHSSTSATMRPQNDFGRPTTFSIVLISHLVARVCSISSRASRQH